MGIKGEHKQMGKEDKPMTEQDDRILDLEEKIQDQAEEISSLKNSLQDQSQHMHNKENYIGNLEYELNLIKNNKIWRTIQAAYTLLFIKTINGVLLLSDNAHSFLQRIKRHHKASENIEIIKKKIEEFTQKPKISLILPIYNPEKDDLKLTLDSVLNQFYPHWELCIVDDASTEEYIPEVLEEYKNKDQRVRVKYLKTRQGISEAFNEALSLAAGEYVAIIKDNMELSLEGLYEVVKKTNQSPKTDLIYSDEDKLDSNRRRIRPVFRQKWSAKRFLTHQYLGSFFVCKKTLIDDVGGFRKEFDRCQDYDLLLRITRRTNAVTHIPNILYQTRMHQNTPPSEPAQQKETHEKARLALQKEMTERGWTVLVKDGRRIDTFKIKMLL